jgi:hypothetical protein
MSPRQSAGVQPHHDLSTLAQRASTSAAASALASLCDEESSWCNVARASSSGRTSVANADQDESSRGATAGPASPQALGAQGTQRRGLRAG